MAYPREPYCIGQETGILHSNRAYDKTVNVRPDLPGNVIMIHGVNDVGTSYEALEQGLCQGLDARLLSIPPGKLGLFTPATYRMPGSKPDRDDKQTLEADPDAVFFKRRIDTRTHSPAIPFYWGFRETARQAGTKNGQRTDRFGNRMDKDLSKGGGPFGNATSTLPDMWNRGLFSPREVGGDPVRPVLSAPGRMYMVLAAQRLAALIAMIRDFDKDEVVTIVAHSQGCLISLLAQAFLLDEGLRPADTLILTHPPYSLVEDTSMFFGAVEAPRMFGGGTDAAMAGHYGTIGDRQTADARLQTLARIVQGVVAKKHATPPLAVLTDHGKYHGMVGPKWVAGADRDNRGKVYLYFCPEDMTVALDNMQGIGWQGVPDFMKGTALSKTRKKEMPGLWGANPAPAWQAERKELKPLSTLGAGFYQRVFTNRQRMAPARKTLEPVLVGMPPHDFALHVKDEDDHAHVAASGRPHRAHGPEVDWPPKPGGWDSFLHSEADQCEGIVAITGEALRVPARADLRGAGQIDPQDIPGNSPQARLPKDEQGPCEAVDPIDAAIATTSKHGLMLLRQMAIDDPRPKAQRIPGSGMFGSGEQRQVQDALNKDKEPGDQCARIQSITRAAGGDDKLLITRYETPNEARRRWQHEVSPKSFHGAIIGSSENHRNVTAYDMAIGGGQASSDPNFYAYLCAVADWRLKMDDRRLRPGILGWNKFQKLFYAYWAAEPKWRKDVIEGNAKYYSSGEMPACVPPLHTGLPSTVVCETVAGIRTLAMPPDAKSATAACVTPAPAKKEGA
ncbi:T6SS effector phospholipase Tle3 domain-containing protein [Janthinobacterium agaricidamnosum]|uniref:Transmembrane protein n=1 Tax=Janthinobacterium agaricidamnosum NBRC 102515 = DSM 9628 TaxID=1349767 RepID=W0V5C4_9BURK|nr:DUF3274 domain-containing protein [Janthinobacterium agaricidamnosum]CDG82447.1 putative uncharacterized protein [Janthinobacterium agaricidamnosum NBRC 102515 = DSM 9628]